MMNSLWLGFAPGSDPVSDSDSSSVAESMSLSSLQVGKKLRKMDGILSIRTLFGLGGAKGSSVSAGASN